MLAISYRLSCFAAQEVPPLPISLVCWLFHHPLFQMDVLWSIALSQCVATSPEDSLIEWVKHLLDDHSRTVIANCLGKYQTDVHNLKSAKQEKKEQPIVDQLEKEAMKNKTVLAECSFRFEHIMREIGQHFEAIKACTFVTSPSEKNLLERLPHIGTKLLIMIEFFINILVRST
jgi:hypothetical protein